MTVFFEVRNSVRIEFFQLFKKVVLKGKKAKNFFLSHRDVKAPWKWNDADEFVET
jgi:hypothetical protein